MDERDRKAMNKDTQGNCANRVLAAGIGYTFGDFRVTLDEKSNELKIIVITNGKNLDIRPKSDNCIILHACS